MFGRFSFSASLSYSIDAQQTCMWTKLESVHTYACAHVPIIHTMKPIPTYTLWHLLFYLLITVIVFIHSILCKRTFLSLFLNNDFDG